MMIIHTFVFEISALGSITVISVCQWHSKPVTAFYTIPAALLTAHYAPDETISLHELVHARTMKKCNSLAKASERVGSGLVCVSLKCQEARQRERVTTWSEPEIQIETESHM